VAQPDRPKAARLTIDDAWLFDEFADLFVDRFVLHQVEV
jgi:hypothetical protein